MVHFTLKQCAYFLAVAEHGGISQAARALNISQPSIAQALDKLESITGLVLFDRYHARGLELTAEGRSFLEHARGLDDHAARVAREADLLHAGVSGEIRLGCFHTIAQFHLAGLIAAHKAALPEIRIAAREMAMDRLSAAVAEGDLDMGITYDIAPGLQSLQVRELAVLTPHIVLAADHPLAGRPSLALGDLANEPYVMFDGPGSRPYFEALLASGGVSPEIAFASPSIESVRSAVANGFGFSLLALRPMHERTYDGRTVVTIPIAGESAAIKIVLAQRQDARGRKVTEDFVEHCQAYFAKHESPALHQSFRSQGVVRRQAAADDLGEVGDAEQ